MKKINNLKLEVEKVLSKSCFDKEYKCVCKRVDRMYAFAAAARSLCEHLISTRKLRKTSNNLVLFYNFIPNLSTDLIPILQYFEIQNIVDLGCGPGNIVMMANEVCPVKSFGFDFDKNIIYAGKQLRPELNLKRKDIFKLEPKDISLADAVYMYQPARNEKTMVRMLAKVLDCMHTEQILLYKMAMSGKIMDSVEKVLKEKAKSFSLRNGWCIAIK